jgi:hypothetical protein
LPNADPQRRLLSIGDFEQDLGGVGMVHEYFGMRVLVWKLSFELRIQYVGDPKIPTERGPDLS